MKKTIFLIKPDNVTDHIQPSLGLGFLATSLKPEHEVYILDFVKLKINLNKFESLIEQYKPDIIGFQCYTFDIYNVRKYLEFIKQKYEKIITILGGPHPTTLPEKTFDFFGNSLDYIFLSESEYSLKDFCNDKNIEEIKGIGYRTDTNEIKYSFPELEMDLDKFGQPDWEIIKPEDYPPAQHGAFYQKFPIAPIITTRGCPYQCTFCAGPIIMGKKIRKRSPKSIIEEIKYLYYKRGIREFHFIDDNFTVDKKFAIKVLTMLKELKLDISWATPNGVRMDTLNDELLGLMKETGLYLISIGIESGSDRVLKLMKKSNTIEKIKKYVSLINSYKIDMAAFFILGFPGETIEEIKKTINLSLSLPLVRANYFTFLPFPNTEVYNKLLENKEINDIANEGFYFMNATYVPKGMTRQQLKNFQRWAFFRFYFRPQIFIKNIMGIKSLTHLKYLIIRFWHWIFY